MREPIVRTGLIFLSGCIVYVVMAACGGSGGDSQSSSGGGSSGTSNGSTSSSSSGTVPNAMADEWYKPGTRLKLRYYDAEDGTKQFAGWFDSMRMIECGFGLHADGSTRCLPIGAAVVWYADTGCTKGIALVSAGAPAPKAASTSAPNGGRHVFGIAAKYTGAVYAGAPGSCSQLSPNVPSGYDGYLTTAEIASGQFVQATAKTAE